MFFVMGSFFTIASYQFFNNDWIFLNHDSFFRENIFYGSTLFNFENEENK